MVESSTLSELAAEVQEKNLKFANDVRYALRISENDPDQEKTITMKFNSRSRYRHLQNIYALLDYVCRSTVKSNLS